MTNEELCVILSNTGIPQNKTKELRKALNTGNNLYMRVIISGMLLELKSLKGQSGYAEAHAVLKAIMDDWKT